MSLSLPSDSEQSEGSSKSGQRQAATFESRNLQQKRAVAVEDAAEEGKFEVIIAVSLATENE